MVSLFLSRKHTRTLLPVSLCLSRLLNLRWITPFKYRVFPPDWVFQVFCKQKKSIFLLLYSLFFVEYYRMKTTGNKKSPKIWERKWWKEGDTKFPTSSSSSPITFPSRTGRKQNFLFVLSQQCLLPSPFLLTCSYFFLLPYFFMGISKLLLLLSPWHQRIPNHQQWYAKWKLSCNIYALHTRFRMFGADLYAQSVIVNKLSASELIRKFIKSALLVGFGRSPDDILGTR